MTVREVGELLQALEPLFEVVRLVDASMATQCSVSEAGELVRAPYQCYAVWNRQRRCENCISAKALAQRGKMTKFEFIDQEVYFIIAQYVEVEGAPYVLELVTHVSDQTLFGAYGKNSFIQAITSYNQTLYTDPLTGAYNRRYYTEQLQSLPKLTAVAMVDVDDFKGVNDTYGHPVGDLLLQEIARRIQARLKGADAVVRFGGDEFVLTFQGISPEGLAQVLEDIRAAAEDIRLPGYPNLRTSLSIGGLSCRDLAGEKLHLADEALYLAKKGKNKIKVTVL